MSKNIFLTQEEWQQRMDEARRKVAAAQTRLDNAKRRLARVIAEKEAKIEPGLSPDSMEGGARERRKA